MWSKIDQHPAPGSKIVIVCDDGCSAFTGLVCDPILNDELVIYHGEDGIALDLTFLGSNAIWAYIPSDYPLHFMEQTEADWY